MAAPDDAGDLVGDLLQAAVRTYGKGQLNIGKLLRASATAVAQAAAAERGFPTNASAPLVGAPSAAVHVHDFDTLEVGATGRSSTSRRRRSRR